MTRFVVVGTGRCGTTWLSDVLTTAGVATGHEDVFTAAGYKEFLWHYGTPTGVVELHGDVSLYAAPLLPGWDGPIIHQVRNPLDCISSLVGWNLPHPYKQGQGGDWINQHLGWRCTTEQVRDSARYWVTWNELCEWGGNYRRWQVESLTPQLLVDEMARLGHHLTVPAVTAAVEQHRPLDYRTHADRASVPLEWGDIPAPERGAVLRLAARYGYEAP